MIENPHLDPSSLAALFDQRSSPGEGDAAHLRSAQEHLDACPECQGQMELLGQVDQELRKALTNIPRNLPGECPPDGTWAMVAKDPSADDAQFAVQHAAGCEPCAGRLDAALAALPQNAAPEHAALRVLETSSPHWRRQQIREFDLVPPVAGVAEPASAPWRAWALAAALLMACAAAYWVWRPAANVEQLLAQAYTDRRPFEFRLPDAGYAAPAGEKGNTSLLSLPEALRRAAAEIDEGLRQPAAHAVWRRRQAYALLLEGSAERALPILDRLLAEQSGDAELIELLACAHVQRAQLDPASAGADVIRALDLLLGLQRRGLVTDRLQYNLALVWEMVPDYPQALAAWRDYLKRDSQSGYAAEARRHRGQLEARLKERNRVGAAVDADPRGYLGLAAGQAPTDFFLDVAWLEWAPRARAGDAVSSAAWRRLADAHRTTTGDPHLDSLWQAPPAAIADLARAIRLNREGDPAAGVAAARQAARLAVVQPASAGFVGRARLEEVYGLNRATDSAGCLRESLALEGSLRETSFHALRTYNLLQRAICLSRAGQAGAAVPTLEMALGLAKAQSLRLMEMRARALLADVLNYTGEVRTGWRLLHETLGAVWNEPAPPVLAQHLYFHLRDMAMTRNCADAGLALAIRTAEVMEPTSDHVLKALAWDTVAGMASSLGQHERSKQATARSQAFFAQVPARALRERYQQAALVHRAGTWLQNPTGEPQPWIVQLEQVRARRLGTGADDRDWRDNLSRLYLLAGDLNRAWELTEEERLSGEGALRRQTRAVRSDILLRRGQSAWLAWEAWQAQPDLRRPVPGGTVYAALVALPSGVVWFLRHGDQLELVRVKQSEQWVKQTASDWLQQAADRHRAAPNALADTLRRELMQPLERQMPASAPLFLEIDPSLGELAPGVLLPGRETGRALDWAHFLRVAGRWEKPGAQELLIVADPHLAPALRRDYPPLADARAEGEEIERLFPGARHITGAAATPAAVRQHGPSARWFHFTGHATASLTSGALLLAPGEGDAEGGRLLAETIGEQSWRRCELAVLSACATSAEAAATPQPLTLARAFLDAGARRAVASLWPVDARATRELMRVFYQALAAGERPSRALAQARTAAQKTAPQGHPYFWAGFQLYGTY